jgi:ADP-heptose:LPS heptosyltransferase
MQLQTQRTIDNYVGRLGIAALRPAAMLLGIVLRRDHRLTVGKEIVWMKLLGGGSLLLAMPMLLGFKRTHPHVKMVLITTPSVKPFAELMGVFDEYRTIDPRGVGRLLSSSLRAMVKTLRADCIVDLEVHSRLTTVFTTLTMARNRVSFWLEDIFWRRGLSSHLVFFNGSSGSFYFYDRISELFKTEIAGREVCKSTLFDACAVPATTSRITGQVCVGFACSDLGQERMLDASQWVQVFRSHLRPGHRVFQFLGGPRDRTRADEIIAAVHRELPGLTLRNRCGERSLSQSVEVIAESTEFWGIDSGLLHLARIAGLRCVSFWGPTDPSTRLRDSWGLDESIHYRKIACSPCVHTTEAPPCRGDNRCIQGLFDEGASAPLGWTPIEYPRRKHGSLV